MFAIAFNKTANGFELSQVEQINAKDITPNDARVFVARESNIDWVLEALETHLNKAVAQAAA